MKKRFSAVRYDDNQFLIFEKNKPFCLKPRAKTKDIVDFLNAVVYTKDIKCNCNQNCDC